MAIQTYIFQLSTKKSLVLKKDCFFQKSELFDYIYDLLIKIGWVWLKNHPVYLYILYEYLILVYYLTAKLYKTGSMIELWNTNK